MMANFDTHKSIKNLVAHGISEKHGEAIIGTFNEYNDTELAKKSDILAVKNELLEVKAELKEDIAAVRIELKEEISNLRVDMHKMRSEILYKLPGILIAVAAIFRIAEQFVHIN